MVSVILAGGQSTRMGQDKGLMKLDGKTWVEIIREKLVSLQAPIFISINSKQKLNYSKIFKESDFIFDNDRLQIGGPLLGLLSAHLAHPNQDILLVACDMINIKIEVIKKLIEEFTKQIPEAIAFKDEHIEPLCAIYSSQGLRKIFLSYQEDKLKNHGLKYVLENLKTAYLSIESEWLSSFKNFNQPSDLN